jgi:hypothetical protein
VSFSAARERGADGRNYIAHPVDEVQYRPSGCAAVCPWTACPVAGLLPKVLGIRSQWHKLKRNDDKETGKSEAPPITPTENLHSASLLRFGEWFSRVASENIGRPSISRKSMQDLSPSTGDCWQYGGLRFRFSNAGPKGKVGELKGVFLKGCPKLAGAQFIGLRGAQ